MKTTLNGIRLVRQLDQVVVDFGNGKTSKPVKIVWARPVTGKGKELSLIDYDKKEVALLKSLDCLDQESRGIAEEELKRRYLIPKIRIIHSINVNFGSRYWDVDTNHGRRKFVMKDPNDYITLIGEGQYVVRDTLGNRYEIESLQGLDARSQAELYKIM